MKKKLFAREIAAYHVHRDILICLNKNSTTGMVTVIGVTV